MNNGFKKEYDVFIAYHGTYEQGGSNEIAGKLYEYLTQKGLKCFYFPKSGGDAYKTNIMKVLQSKTFLLVASNTIHRLPDKRIDNENHLELWTEINTFFAMVQAKLAQASAAKVYACGNWYKGDEALLHDLFGHRTHIYDNPDGSSMEEAYRWIKSQIESENTWSNKQSSNEISDVLTKKAAIKEKLGLDSLIAKAKVVKSVGISINELTIRANPDSIDECINNGGKIELLFLNPNGKYTAIREEEEGWTPGYIKSITQVNINSAVNKRNKLGDKKENYSIYTYDLIPRMNLIFIDDLLILQYYANNISGLDNPALIIKKTGDSPIFNYCVGVYNYIKENSTKYEVKDNAIYRRN